jgi:hypothetical protein
MSRSCSSIMLIVDAELCEKMTESRKDPVHGVDGAAHEALRS